MHNKIIYLRLFCYVIWFYAKKHPYQAAWDVVCLCVCIWNCIQTPSVFWLIWFALMVLVPAAALRIWHDGPPIERIERKLRTRDELKKYLARCFDIEEENGDA